MLGIAGSPGSGKTTLAIALVDELNRRSPGVAVHLPMDGFHLANSTLDHLGLHDRKGAIETFDGWGFVALLDRLRAERGHTVYAPSFHRVVDEGVAGGIAIEDSVQIVVVEGNYLLADGDPWSGARTRFDEHRIRAACGSSVVAGGSHADSSSTGRRLTRLFTG